VKTTEFPRRKFASGASTIASKTKALNKHNSENNGISKFASRASTIASETKALKMASGVPKRCIGELLVCMAKLRYEQTQQNECAFSVAVLPE
jgi:hypothetical protein